MQDEGSNYRGEQAALAVLSSPADIQKIGGTIDEAGRRFLENQDYHTATIIIVFQGWKSSGMSLYSATIQQVSRAIKGRILVHTHFVTPRSNARTGAETSPVQIIRIPTDGLDVTQFVQLDKGTPIRNVKYFE